MEEQIEALTARLAALEAAAAPPEPVDYSDPPLYFLDENGAPVDTDSIEKVPDLVRDLPSFTGDPTDLNSWLKDAGGLVEWYTPRGNATIAKRNTFHAICKTIRRKIKGEAHNALVASNVNCNWHLIKRTLITYYGEKRDLATLDYQLASSFQKGRDLKDFYDEINNIQSLISNCISIDPQFSHPEAARSVLALYNRKAVDAFIRGLDGEVGKFLKNANVDSIASAYSYCLTFQNIEFRRNLIKPKIYDNVSSSRHNPSVIPFKTVNVNPRANMRFPVTQPMYSLPRPIQVQQRPPQPFYPPPQHYPPQHYNPQQQYRPPQQPYPQQQYRPPQPIQPFRPPAHVYQGNQSRVPDPIDTDVSMRTATTNYANRPPKRPRNFHIETQQQCFEPYEEYLQQIEEEEDSSFERYCKTVETQDSQTEPEPEAEVAELNFLE